MALPLLALPIVYTGLVSLISAGFNWIVKNIGFKALLWLAVNGGYLLSWVAVTAVFVGLLNGLVITIPTIVSDVWGWFMPPNAGACISAIIAARVAMTIHEFRLKMLDMKLRAFS